MRTEEELSPEDLDRVRQVTSTGIHSVERGPFRGFRLLLVIWLVIALMGVGSWLIAHLIGVV